MADLGEDVELGEVLLILAVLGVGGYLVYNFVSGYFKSSLCLNKIGTIPGITGATKAQACAPKIAGCNLKAGGTTIWSCGSDFDYAEPCGNVVQVRHSFWGQLFGTPVTYTTVPRDCYVRPSGGTINPAFACCYSCVPASAAGSPACNGGKQTSTPNASCCFSGLFLGGGA
jgi:hypothetical protein